MSRKGVGQRSSSPKNRRGGNSDEPSVTSRWTVPQEGTSRSSVPFLEVHGDEGPGTSTHGPLATIWGFYARGSQVELYEKGWDIEVASRGLRWMGDPHSRAV